MVIENIKVEMDKWETTLSELDEAALLQDVTGTVTVGLTICMD